LDHSSNDSDSETKDILLMGIKTQTKVLENINIDSIEEENNDIDAEVDLKDNSYVL
jgi:hypothetical protein